MASEKGQHFIQSNLANSIEIFTREGHEIRALDELPLTLGANRLSNSTWMGAEANFGKMLFQHYKGKGFDIWYSTYDLKQPIQLLARSGMEVLELHTCYQNGFSGRWDGIPYGQMDEKQYDLSFAPFIENETNFQAAGIYETFDIHYQKEILEKFAPDFPLLNTFMQKVAKGEATSLLGTTRLLMPRMSLIIGEILASDFAGVLADSLFEAKATELLIYVLNATLRAPAPYFPPQALEHAKEAREIILSDPETQYTASLLAKKVGTNIFTLRAAFKHLYGYSLFRYAEQARMEFAKKLLLEGKFNVTEVATRVGYPDSQNFSAAFKRVFKTTPGELRKRGR